VLVSGASGPSCVEQVENNFLDFPRRIDYFKCIEINR
jgi:hypothetical protein